MSYWGRQVLRSWEFYQDSRNLKNLERVLMAVHCLYVANL